MRDDDRAHRPHQCHHRHCHHGLGARQQSQMLQQLDSNHGVDEHRDNAIVGGGGVVVVVVVVVGVGVGGAGGVAYGADEPLVVR
jgi:hypothetical protein